MIIKSRRTFSQFSFLFFCEFLTDIAPPYCVHCLLTLLDWTAPISSPSWARILCTNLWQECRLGVSDNATALSTMLLIPLPSCALAPSVFTPNSKRLWFPREGTPSSSGLGLACTQEEMNPCGQISARAYRYSVLKGQLWTVISTISRAPWGTESRVLSVGLCLISHPYLSTFLSLCHLSLLGILSNKPLFHETCVRICLWGELGQS